MHAVVAEQVRVGLGAAEIVDRDRHDVVAATLDHRAQHQPADAAEAVDGDLNGHGQYPFLAFLAPCGAELRRGH